jgi:hypothetical protein
VTGGIAPLWQIGLKSFQEERKRFVALNKEMKARKEQDRIKKRLKAATEELNKRKLKG